MRKSTIEKMEEHINKVTKLPIEIKKKYRKQFLFNLLLCMTFVIYITAIIIGKRILNYSIFLKCLKILTINMLAITIIIFEDAYKKDNALLGLNGIEILVITLITLFSENIFKTSSVGVNLIVAYIAVYYIIKSFIIYRKEKKNYFRNNNDIPEIIKKESKDKLKPIMEKINEENINKKKKNSKKKETTTKKDKAKILKEKTKQEKKM